MIMRRIQVQNLKVAHDNLTGKLNFNWNQTQFKTIMSLTQFQLRFTTNVYTKKIKLANQKNCTLMAYQSGSFLINGCNSKEQMQKVVNDLFNDRINIIDNVFINFAQKLVITHMRTRVNFQFEFKIADILQYFKSFGEQISKQSRNKINNCKGLQKIYIPRQFHQHKQITVYLWRSGGLQIYKSNLVQNIYKIASKLYENLLCNFINQQKIKIKQKKLPKQQKTNETNNMEQDQSYQLSKYKYNISQYQREEQQQNLNEYCEQNNFDDDSMMQ